MELADEEREQGGSVGQGVGVDVFVSSMGVGADVAQAAANAGVQAARAYTSTAQAGRDDATTILDQLAGTVLTGTHVDARRDSTTATVTVTGQAVAVLPGLHLPVRASVTAPRERVPGIPYDAGTITAFTVILVLAVLAFAGLVLDAGLAIATKVQAVSDAQSAARAGARELDVAALRTSATIRLDPARAAATARNWLSRAGVTGTVTVTPDTVTVTITTARRTQLLHLVGLTSIPVTATATAQAVRP